MSCTVIVIFRAKPGRGGALSKWLSAKHAPLTTHTGFERISLHRDIDDPDRIVEIEHWARAQDHRRMVETVDATGGWDELEALTTEEPVTMYLEQVTS